MELLVTGNWGALALAIVLIAWAASMRTVSGTWLQPSAFFALWWCGAGILPLVFAPNEPVGPHAMLWLIVSSISVSIGALAGNWGFRTRRIATSQPSTDRELYLFAAALGISVIMGLGSNIAFVAGSSIPLRDVLDVDRFRRDAAKRQCKRSPDCFRPSGGFFFQPSFW